jgi:D-beta-D-heptose 7-phosphate kinase/D-beta-D-heptose 1-phosphate adenosyltransferase
MMPMMRELMLNKLKSGTEAEKYLNRERFAGKKIVFTNGCFDVLHIGHIRLLMAAADLGDTLVVGLNSDDSVKRLKGENRPVHTQEIRAEQLAALVPVDAIIIFEEDTPENLIQLVKPDVLVKGGDYTEDSIVGASFVKSYGGEVVIFSTVEGFSSSGIIKTLGS